MTVASASRKMANHPEMGVVRSRKPFKFWRAPTISLEQLNVSGAVDLVGWSVR